MSRFVLKRNAEKSRAAILINRGARVLLIAFCATLFLVARADTAREWNDRGIEHMNKNEFAEAVRDFKHAATLAPDEPTVKVNQALALNAWGVSQGQDAQYEAAVKNLEEARKISPERSEITRNLATLRVNWGASLMLEKKYKEADALLQLGYADAEDADRKLIDARRSQNLGLWARSAIDAKDSKQGEELLESSLALDPENIGALLDLATLYYEAGSSAEALALYEQAAEAGAKVDGLDDRIARLKRETATESNFKVFNSQHFRVSYEGEENGAAARTILSMLTKAWRDIGGQLAAYPESTIPVVLYTWDQFQKVTLAPHWSGGVYDGKIRVPFAGEKLDESREAALMQTLSHEFTHALVRDIGGHEVPTWLNEGLATYYELPRDARSERAQRDEERLKALLATDKLAAIADLPEQFIGIADHDEAERNYLISRGFVSFLIERYGPGRIKALLVRLKAGESIETAAHGVYFDGLKELDRVWRRSLAD